MDNYIENPFKIKKLQKFTEISSSIEDIYLNKLRDFILDKI